MLGIVSKVIGVVGGIVLTALLLVGIAAASSGCAGGPPSADRTQRIFLFAQLGHDGSVVRCWFASQLTLYDDYTYLTIGDTEIRIAAPYNYAVVEDDIATAAHLIGVEAPEQCMGIPPTPVAPAK